MGLRLFLEPVIQVTNYFKSLTGNLGDIAMTGLSGGGWTTSMIAALDPRIKLSLPVAGSAPLYLRNQFNWTGDTEESYPPLFDENIGAGGTGGGVATWLEIYALGGYGAARRQVMITNERDDCCFAGAYFADTFKTVVANVVVNQLSQGTWSHFLDTQSVQHEISTNAISNVIVPELLNMPVGPGNITVHLTSPANGVTVQSGTGIPLAANTAGNIVKVEFFDGSNKLGQALAPGPYTMTWNGALAGSHTVTARATDNLGVTATSAPIAITVQ